MSGLINFLIETAIPIYIRPARNIGGIYATVTIKEITDDELEITQHPVQSGATISDHAFKKPIKVEVTALWSDQVEPLSEIYQDLLDLQSSFVPFTVVTGKRSLPNMLLKSIRQDTDRETENVLAVIAIMQEVIIVDVEVATVPPREDQAFPGTTDATANAGSKAAQGLALASTGQGTTPSGTGVTNLFLGQGGQIPPPPVKPSNESLGLVAGF